MISLLLEVDTAIAIRQRFTETDCEGASQLGALSGRDRLVPPPRNIFGEVDLDIGKIDLVGELRAFSLKRILVGKD